DQAGAPAGVLPAQIAGQGDQVGGGAGPPRPLAVGGWLGPAAGGAGQAEQVLGGAQGQVELPGEGATAGALLAGADQRLADYQRDGARHGVTPCQDTGRHSAQFTLPSPGAKRGG